MSNHVLEDQGITGFLTIIGLELRHVVRHGLLGPVYGDVKGHEGRLPEVAAVEVQHADVCPERLGPGLHFRGKQGVAAVYLSRSSL